MNKHIIILLLCVHFIIVPAEQQVSREARRKSMQEKIEHKQIKEKMALLQERNINAKVLRFINCDIANLKDLISKLEYVFNSQPSKIKNLHPDMWKEHFDSLNSYLIWAMDDYQFKLEPLLKSLMDIEGISELKDYFDVIRELCQISIEPEKIKRGLEIANNILAIWQESAPCIEADLKSFSVSCHEECIHGYLGPVAQVSSLRKNVFF